MPTVTGTATATQPGVSGDSATSFAGVRGSNTGTGVGVRGFATNGDAVRGDSSDGGAGVRGVSTHAGHVGVVGENNSGGFAGLFVGNVDVRGNIFSTGDVILRNADAAEQFAIREGADATPGMVMVLGEGGEVEPCSDGYDQRVVGVVAGAGSYKPAIVLDHRDDGSARAPISILGKVSCFADAAYGPIAVGDLLTTSPSTGHAMRVGKKSKLAGAVIGKAMQPLAMGKGMIDMLIMLR